MKWILSMHIASNIAFPQSFQHTMVQYTLFLVAALLINTLSYCSAENVYCVKPAVTSCSSCPQNSTHCNTLSEYAQEAEMYLTSNTTLVFLPGDHILQTNITVANVTRLTMRGESSSSDGATIVCSACVSWPQLYKYGGFQNIFLSIYLL